MPTVLQNYCIKDCQEICSYIDPTDLFLIDQRYYEDYLPFYKEYLHDMFEYASNQNPNFVFYISGRIKAPASVNHKHVTEIKKRMDIVNLPEPIKERQINELFSFLKDNSETSSEKLSQIREIINEYTMQEKLRRVNNVIAYLDNLLDDVNSNDVYSLFSITDIEKRTTIIKEMLKNLNESLQIRSLHKINDLIDKFDDVAKKDKFERIYSLLTEKERKILTRLLGTLYDIYAYRIIVQAVNVPFEHIICKDNTFFIEDETGKHIPIVPAQKIPRDNIYKTKAGVFITCDPTLLTNKINLSELSVEELKQYEKEGKVEKISERNLLYEPNLSQKYRHLENVSIDENNMVTLLRDSIELDNHTIDIFPDTLSIEDNIIKINGEILDTSKKMKLCKYDETTLRQVTYKISESIDTFDEQYGLKTILKRKKDYLASPKKDSGYMSIHNTKKNKDYKFFLERQDRTLLMEDDSENEELLTGHNNFKSSKDYIKDLLQDSKISIEELFAHFILFTHVTEFDNNLVPVKKIKQWEPGIDFVFEKVLGESFEQFIKNRSDKEEIADNYEFDIEID